MINEYAKLHENDVGSAQVQVNNLTLELSRLEKHCKENPKDLHSLRGLKAIADHRRRLVKYINRKYNH